MFLILFTCLLGLGLLWLFRKWNHTRKYWERRNVPHGPMHPIMGSMTFLFRKNVAIWFREVYDRYKTPYVGIWLFWRPALVINSPEIARRVLVKDSALFRNRFASAGKNDPTGTNIFTLKEPLWSAIRRRLSPELTTGKLRNIQGEISSKSKQCVKRIKIDMEKYKQVNIRMMFTDFSTDVIGNLSFGVNSDATLTGESPLRTVTKDFMKFSLFRGFGWCCIFFIPELVDVFGFTMFPKRATSYLKEVYQKILAQRGGYDANIDEGKDIFDALRKIKQESDMNKEDLPEKVLIAQAAAFLQGGFDATGTALAFGVYELAFQPDLQEKVFHEIVNIKQSIEDNDFDMDILKTATYLNCVVKETLRKYSSMGWLDRIAAKDYKIDGNLTIPAGTPVYVNAVGIHFDPDYYKDPNKFDPDRFLPDNEKRMKPFTYLPFGEGVRSCIARHLAIQTMTFVLAHVILNYKILPKKNAELPSKIGFQKYGLLIGPGQNLYVDFITRD